MLKCCLIVFMLIMPISFIFPENKKDVVDNLSAKKANLKKKMEIAIDEATELVQGSIKMYKKDIEVSYSQQREAYIAMNSMLSSPERTYLLEIYNLSNHDIEFKEMFLNNWKLVKSFFDTPSEGIIPLILIVLNSSKKVCTDKDLESNIKSIMIGKIYGLSIPEEKRKTFAKIASTICLFEKHQFLLGENLAKMEKILKNDKSKLNIDKYIPKNRRIILGNRYNSMKFIEIEKMSLNILDKEYEKYQNILIKYNAK